MDNIFDEETQNILNAFKRASDQRLSDQQQMLFDTAYQRANNMYSKPEKPSHKKPPLLFRISRSVVLFPVKISGQLLLYACSKIVDSQKTKTRQEPQTEEPEVIDLVSIDGIYWTDTKRKN